MKKLLVLSVFLLSILKLISQSQGISYQAVLINENAKEIPGIDIKGNYMPNQALTMRFTISNESGIVNYQEEHETQTDEYGMINLVIGEGIATAQSPGTFSDIDWNGVAKELTVEISMGTSSNNFIEFSSEKLYFVPYAFHRNITATGHMIIDGSSLLNDTLTVANNSPAFLTGNLAVDGLASFNGLVTFQDIVVQDSTNLNGILSVNNGSPTDLSGTLDVGGATNLNGSLLVNQNTNLNNTLTVNAGSSLNGQVTINADVNGDQSNINSYPLRVQGSNQGIAVTVDGDRNTSKNFITFWDAKGVQGRIEGQTSSELHNSFNYIWDQTYSSLMTATQTAMVIADLAGIDDADASVIEGIQAVAEIAHFVKRNVQREKSIGIAFVSGGADYAEWLEKYDVNEKFSYGDIVGVKGGKISKKMINADNYMVISKDPVVLGNLPPKGIENHFEKVAFMGQVSVKIVGLVHVGDYILTSGLNDGFGIAVSPENMGINDYSKIVGVAWTKSSGKDFYSMINVAIGINTNAMAAKLKQQQIEIEHLKQQMNTVTGFLKSKYSDFKSESELNVNKELKFRTS